MDEFESLFSPSQSKETETVEAPVEQTLEVEAPEIEADTATVEAPKVETETHKEDRKGWVPVDALLEERTKRQEAEKLRAEYEAKLEEAQVNKQRQTRPDPFDSPDDFDKYMKEQIATAITSDRVQRQQEEQSKHFTKSYSKAAEDHCEDTVKAAIAWASEKAKTDDAWGRTGLSQPDPVAWILEQQDRHAQFTEFNNDPQGFIARKAAELGTAGTADAALANSTQMAAKVVAAPKSLASTGSNVKSVNNKTGDEAFMAIFRK